MSIRFIASDMQEKKVLDDGCDLRLMSVATADGLANEGHNLVIVALVDTNLHIRIFDANGKRVVDKAEDKLISGETLTTLKKQLNPLPDESGLSQEQKQQITRDATSIAGHTLDDRNKLRYAYIIDSLKHLDEVDLLRTLFRDAFCMIGVVADDSVCKRRLLDQKQIQENEFKEISDAESKKANSYHQNPMDAILKSDYFFENNYDTPDKINHECKCLLNLLFQSSIVTPRQDEYGMRLAFTAAKGSACLSRQVGAAIISSHNTVLATGCNDVPRFGGGLYSSEALVDNQLRFWRL